MLIPIETYRQCECVDITEQLQALVHSAKMHSGSLDVFCPHTTCGLTLNEGDDPDVLDDLLLALERLAPQSPDYKHWEGNSPAHIKTSLIGSSLRLCVEEGQLLMGTWQRCFLVEFDGPRNRQIRVKMTCSEERIQDELL
ncbi:MAG: YjbQ family protein [Gemmatimonadaceae bacterium]|nr:YjbQ family protein [Gloeobacterales cyanobacterium ES-bin-141]